MRLSALRPLLKFSTTRKMASRSNLEPSNIVEQYTEVSQGPETTLQNSPQKSSLSGLSEPQYSTAEAEAKSKKSSKANPALKKSKSAGFSAKKRKHGHISLDQEYGSDTDLEPKGKEPKNWREVMALIEEKRATIVAPVDEVGADSLGDWNEVERGTLDPKNARFRTLLALMLSSQTKDQVTAKAMENLKAKFNPLSVASMLTATPEEIDECINKVGFHNRKSQYISQVVQILQKEYDGDVPSTITAVTDLPGVGPKMGFLLMQIAWKKTVGIGVDTHVHRISNRYDFFCSMNRFSPLILEDSSNPSCFFFIL